jgi:dTDP-4-amino-4,6-dideoxygalactose transaminase
MVLDVTSIAALQESYEAVIPVHLYGQMCDMKSISEFLGDTIPLIEDAAQSQGANFDGEQSGKYSLGVATSFYPGKNLGAFGDAGGIVTEREATYQSCLAIRNYGSPQKYYHPVLGFNSRLDSLQAVVLSAKLRTLENMNESRRKIAENYLSLLSGCAEVRLPKVAFQADHVWHLFVIRVNNRDKVAEIMLEQGVQTIIHYPKPIHLQESLVFLGYKRGDFPISEDIADNCLSLPLYPGMTDEEQAYVVASLIKALELSI